MCERIDGLTWLQACCLHLDAVPSQPTAADREGLPCGPGFTAEGERFLAAIEAERAKLAEAA